MNKTWQTTQTRRRISGKTGKIGKTGKTWQTTKTRRIISCKEGKTGKTGKISKIR